MFGGAPLDPLAGLDGARTRLVVGLGNPGQQYLDTRHNVGFRAVDDLARRAGVSWAERPDLRSLVAVAPLGELTLVVAKPQTFMNRSGEAVTALLDGLGLPEQQALVVYDDMDLPFGVLRMRQRGSPGTHNGMRSIIAALGSDNIPRLRMGISQPGPGAAIDHVLGEFDADERQAVDELVSRAAEAAQAWAIEGPASAMNRYNKA
jgi:PTH1 family peptidyl-tRNA hydrolase